MADQTLKKLVSIIESADGGADMRRAAVRVAAALKPSTDPKLHQALLSALDQDDPELRALAAEALGELRADSALARLVKLVQGGGGGEVEAAVRAIGHMGARGAKALGKVMHEASPVLRRRIAAVLAFAGTDSAVLATAHSLVDDDAGVVEASAKSLASEAPLLTRGQKHVLAEHLLEMLTPKKSRRTKAGDHAGGQLSAASEAGMMRVLAALHAPEAEDIYWSRLDQHQTLGVRSAALQALAGLEPPDTDSKLQKLFGCAAASDFQVVAPALMLLKKVPANRKTARHWLSLFEAPDVAAHLLAIEKLREIDAPDVARALLKQLHHPDRGLRDNALAALLGLKAGREVLRAALLDAETPDEAWLLAKAQLEVAKQWPAAQRTKFFAAACQLQESNDRRADAYWYLLREMDSDRLRDKLVERATALRKKKDWPASLGYWRLLTRDPAVSQQLRFELAATSLKVSSHDAAAASREADPALHQFNRLLQDPSFDLAKLVRSAKWLDESDLFYVGFHFAEQGRAGREFGRKVLELVCERWPKTQLAKSAKQKLKSEGFV